MTSITQPPQKSQSHNFNANGYPINPATGQPYTRDEIVTDESIPYPQHVDPAKPGPYWARRTQAQLETQKTKAAKKSKARRRSSTRRPKAKTIPYLGQQEAQGKAVVDLVERNKNTPELEQRTILFTSWSASGPQLAIMELQ